MVGLEQKVGFAENDGNVKNTPIINKILFMLFS